MPQRRRPILQRWPGLLDGVLAGMVVGGKQGELQVHVHPVGRVQPADDVDQVVRPPRLVGATGRGQGVALGDGVLGQRLHPDDIGQQISRLARLVLGHQQLGPAGPGRREAGK